MNESTAKRNAIVWITIVFVLGLALGGVFGYFYGHRSVVIAATNTLPPSEAERRARRLDQLTQELSLTPEQRQQMDAALSQIHAEYKTIHDRNYAQFDADMDQARQKGRDQMRAILTPEQKPKFEEFLKRLDEERKKNGPPPLGPPPSR
jgi:Spy/CpxP family protein refolding chaperone